MSAGADSGSEGEFLAKINAERTSRGLGALKVDSGLRTHARKHTGDMIDAGEIYHSTSAELTKAAGSGWSAIAENVGRGGTPSSLHEAFMNSPGHKQNILGDYNYVGIGTASKKGVLYVTVVFMKKGSTSSNTTTTTSPPSTTTTGAKDTGTTKSEPTTSTTEATTTTTLPSTTTTLIVGPDKAVTPGVSCLEATRFWQLCHD